MMTGIAKGATDMMPNTAARTSQVMQTTVSSSCGTTWAHAVRCVEAPWHMTSGPASRGSNHQHSSGGHLSLVLWKQV